MSKPSRVLIYTPLAVLGHHFETDLEIVQNHLDAGDEVTMVTCQGQLKPIGFMGCLGVGRCLLCVSRSKQGLSLLRNTENFKTRSIGELSPVKSFAEEALDTVDKAKVVLYKGVDIGSAYMSSLISELRDANPNLKNRVKETRKALELIAGLTDRFEEILDQTKPDLVYFFNGRFCLYRPLLRLCSQKKIQFQVHERGSSNSLYSLTPNAMPHDLDTKVREIEVTWNNDKTTIEEKKASAKSWYERRAAGQSTNWRSFTDNQDLSELPSGWDEANQNIAIYVSSEDEFASVPGWDLGIFNSQSDAIAFLCETFKDQPHYKFFVRMHPNLRGLKNPGINAFYTLPKRFANCIVIAPDSSVSTYTLLRRAKKVVSFGSTVGVEATFWEQPSIQVGKSLYAPIGGVNQAISRESLVAMVSKTDLAPASRDAALKYGYWASTFGIPFVHYQPIGLTAGAFNGAIITGAKGVMFLNYFFVALRDIGRVFLGRYSFWHFGEKIRNKLKVLKAS
jgi:hypothetical protein